MRGRAPSAYMACFWIALQGESIEVVQAFQETERHVGDGSWIRQVKERQRPQPDEVRQMPMTIRDDSAPNLPRSSCTAMYQNCNETRLCCNGAATCFEKNEAYADCRTSCKPGIQKTDEAQFATPWSCIQIDSAIHEWEVLGHDGTDVRARPDDLANKLDWKPRGSVLQGLQEGSWLSLEARAGFVRIWDNGQEQLKQGRFVSYRLTTTHATASNTMMSATTTGTATVEFTPGPLPEMNNITTAQVCGAGHKDGKRGPPITLEAFKKCLFEWYPTAEVAYVALGSSDPAHWVNRIWKHAFPLRPEEFNRRTHELKPPLSNEQAQYVFRKLDANSDNLLEGSEFVNALGLQQQLPVSERNASRLMSSSTLMVGGGGGTTIQNAVLANGTRSPSHTSGESGNVLIFGIPVAILINGILASLLLPCVFYVGCRIYGTVTKHDGRGWRDTYAKLGGGRTALAVLPQGQVFRNRRVWHQRPPVHAQPTPPPPTDQSKESQSSVGVRTDRHPVRDLVRDAAECPSPHQSLPHTSLKKMSL